MKQALIQTLCFAGILSIEEATKIAASFNPKNLKSSEHFIVQDKKSAELAFINDGIMRAYITNEDMQESTRYFFTQNQFIVDLPSFNESIPAASSIQAVTEVQLLVINNKEWQSLCEEYPKLILLAKTISEMTFLNKIKDNDFLRFGTGRQKYIEFIKRYPKFILSVPLQYIASYLQITPQSLSRLRKDISNS